MHMCTQNQTHHDWIAKYIDRLPLLIYYNYFLLHAVLFWDRYSENHEWNFCTIKSRLTVVSCVASKAEMRAADNK